MSREIGLFTRRQVHHAALGTTVTGEPRTSSCPDAGRGSLHPSPGPGGLAAATHSLFLCVWGVCSAAPVGLLPGRVRSGRSEVAGEGCRRRAGRGATASRFGRSCRDGCGQPQHRRVHVSHHGVGLQGIPPPESWSPGHSAARVPHPLELFQNFNLNLVVEMSQFSLEELAQIFTFL